MTIGILATLLVAAAVCGDSGESGRDRSVASVAAVRTLWRPALGDAGPATADRLIAQHTPACRTFESAIGLAREVRDLHNAMLGNLNLDPRLPMRSAQVQRTLSRQGYTIEVIRLEAIPGVYLPVNLYLPDAAQTRESPLVISPIGCGSATWSEHVQLRAANLALLGMTVVVAEGYCNNGVRAALQEGTRPQVGYARQSIGLPGEPYAIFVQELMATIGWALQNYEQIDPKRIGVAGYSYGGQTALYLAQADRRVRSISIPATRLGDDCYVPGPNDDIALETGNPDFAWSAPPELPILPANSRLLMLYPRPTQTISGRADPRALPQIIGPAMDYAGSLYALGGHPDRLRFEVDGSHHEYGSSRREGSYVWFAHTLLGGPLEPIEEQPVTLLGRAELSVDISGTLTMADELRAAADRETARRFRRGKPAGDVMQRVASALSELFPEFVPQLLVADDAWSGKVHEIEVQARVFRGPHQAFPLFIFRHVGGPRGKPLLYLPQRGTYEELETILGRLASRETVISIDYPGIGELKSDRILTHTLARYFMHHDPSLPKMNVELLRSYLMAAGLPAVDLDARGWAASFYGLLLATLEPERIAGLELSGVPENELEWIGSAGSIPDLLLWGGLFSKLTAAELGAIAARDHRIIWTHTQGLPVFPEPLP